MLPPQIGKAIGKALMPLTGGVGKELSDYLGDQIRFLRWKSALKILERAKTFCGKKNIQADRVPVKFIVPFLESASFENVETDKTLSDMWSALFASAVTAYQARHAAYIDLLKKLSTRDADFILRFYKKLISEDIYEDSGFDPDLWNVNDKQEFMDDFDETFKARGMEIIKYYESAGFFAPTNLYDRLVEECARANSLRLDIVPLAYDLGFYVKGEKINSITGPFKSSRRQLDSIGSLVALGLMEKFEVVSRYPEKLQKGPICCTSGRLICDFEHAWF